MKILITGSAGFIGFNLHKFLNDKFQVIGCDNLSSISKKTQKIRIKEIKRLKLKFKKVDLRNFKEFDKLKSKKFDVIIHLAAQPGVRISQIKPNKTLDNNLKTFVNVYEFAKKNKIKFIIFASSSSVYGNTKKFSENLSKVNPISVYGVSKITNEFLAKVYHFLYGISSIGLRFFTVYGPYGREDMSYYKFLNSIKENKSITIYGDKSSKRSFTYISDICISIYKLLGVFNKEKNFNEIYNIGTKTSRSLTNLTNIIKKNVKVNYKEKFISRNKADVYKTKSNNQKLINKIKFSPKISLEEGMKLFFDWYKKNIDNKII